MQTGQQILEMHAKSHKNVSRLQSATSLSYATGYLRGDQGITAFLSEVGI